MKHNIIQICLYELNSFFLDTTLATKLVSLWLNDTFNIYTGDIRPFTPFSEVQKHLAHTWIKNHTYKVVVNKLKINNFR